MVEKLLDAHDLPRFWWSELCALPPSNDSKAYARLKRVWFDQTGTRKTFQNPACEVHLVCTLFENMVLFAPAVWVPALIEAAGIQDVPTEVLDCSWSYEFEDAANIRVSSD